MTEMVEHMKKEEEMLKDFRAQFEELMNEKIFKKTEFKFKFVPLKHDM